MIIVTLTSQSALIKRFLMGSSHSSPTPVIPQVPKKTQTPVNILADIVSLKYTTSTVPNETDRRLFVPGIDLPQPYIGIDTTKRDGTYAKYDTRLITDPYQLLQISERHAGDDSGKLRATLEQVFVRLCTATRTSQCHNGASKCMALRSLGGNDGRCQEIAEKLDNNFVDGLKLKWCLDNTDSTECDCLNRDRSKAYVDLKDFVVTHENLFARDECWYKPCTSDGAMTLSTQKANKCGAKVCINVNAMTAGDKINTGSITDSVQCFNKAHPLRDSSSDWASGLHDYIEYFNVALGVLLLIIILYTTYSAK
ncbi:hypothetical protein [Heliothis virescens ascovirus 3j]|uniref:Myristylated membrane protein-like protein n=2 Tax=unclassified Ascovirus TaxID=328613 RepID=A0A2Z5UZD6_9VIRU|nr:hypothetical protein [Heliothis virescens ascovirus 3j]